MMDKKCKKSSKEGGIKSDLNEVSKELEQKNKVVVVKDNSVFRLGECFDSYEDLLKRLASHSKQSMVHYWRRDSRTVQRAYMKTTRPLEPKLVYYYVKYACVFGGQKFLPRGKGQRQSMTMRLDCPAHIMVRANKSGRQLEVISVCNTHNHPITEQLYKSLPQDRKLEPSLKEEVLKLLKLGTEHKYVIEYIHSVTGKTLTNKDLFNLGAGDKKPRPADSSRRKEFIEEPEVESGEEGSAAAAVESLCKVEGEVESPAYEPIGSAHVEIFYDKVNHNDAKKNVIEYLYPPSTVNALHMIQGSDLDTSDIIIENVGLSSTSFEIPLDDSICTFQQVGDTTPPASAMGPFSKIKLKLMNVEEMVVGGNKATIEQGADTNENTLLDGVGDLPLDHMDLNNIVLIRDSSPADAPLLHMYKGGGRETLDVDMDHYMPFHTDQDFVSFPQDHSKETTVSSMHEDTIAMLVEDNCHIPAALDIQPDQVCESCGRVGLLLETEIEELKREKEKIEHEVRMLEMKRDLLRGEVKGDVPSKEWSYVLQSVCSGPVQYILVDQ